MRQTDAIVFHRGQDNAFVVLHFFGAKPQTGAKPSTPAVAQTRGRDGGGTKVVIFLCVLRVGMKGRMDESNGVTIVPHCF
jgi:hypothetical protein